MLRILAACALACALAGCVVAPAPYDHPHGWYGPGPGWHHGGGWR